MANERLAAFEAWEGNRPDGLYWPAFAAGWNAARGVAAPVVATTARWMYSEPDGWVVWDAERHGEEWVLPDTEHVVARLQARIAELEREVGAAHADAAARETARGEG